MHLWVNATKQQFLNKIILAGLPGLAQPLPRSLPHNFNPSTTCPGSSSTYLQSFLMNLFCIKQLKIFDSTTLDKIYRQIRRNLPNEDPDVVEIVEIVVADEPEIYQLINLSQIPTDLIEQLYSAQEERTR